MGNDKKVGEFLKSCTEYEYRLLGVTMSIRDGLRNLTMNGVQPTEIIARFKISKKTYNDFISGNFDYHIRHLATLNAWFMEIENLKEKAPFQVAKA